MAFGFIAPGAVAVPEGYQSVTFRHSRRELDYQIVTHEPPTDFEKWHMSTSSPSGVALLTLDLLGGCGIFIDVGANIGLIAIPVAKDGSQVFCVEPHPENCLMLTIASSRNALPNINICQGALSDHDGIVGFSGTEAWGQVTAADNVQSVMCLKMDTFAALIHDISSLQDTSTLVIKIDVEGHEAMVLKGAKDVLSNLRPIVIIESIEIEGESPADADSAKRILEHFDYALYLMRNTVLSPCAAGDLQEGHVSDYLAIPAERAGILAGTSWELRSLTQHERLDWVREMIEFPMHFHHRHSLGVLQRWQREGNSAFGEALPLVNLLRSQEDMAEWTHELDELLRHLTD